jgi:hypothetical protein
MLVVRMLLLVLVWVRDVVIIVVMVVVEGLMVQWRE